MPEYSYPGNAGIQKGEFILAKKQRIRIELPLNPQSSALDAVLLAKLNACVVPPTHLLRVLLMNHFAQQPGGLGLTEEEQAAFVDLSPRFSRKSPAVKTAEKTPAASGIQPHHLENCSFMYLEHSLSTNGP
jgi:hypothetical protein